MKSIEELTSLCEKMKSQIELTGEYADKTRVVVGMATCGIASGARPVFGALKKAVEDKKMENIVVTQTGCIGLCQYEPIVEVTQNGREKVTYIKMTPEKMQEVVEEHLSKGNIVAKYTISSVLRG